AAAPGRPANVRGRGDAVNAGRPRRRIDRSSRSLAATGLTRATASVQSARHGRPDRIRSQSVERWRRGAATAATTAGSHRGGRDVDRGGSAGSPRFSTLDFAAGRSRTDLHSCQGAFRRRVANATRLPAPRILIVANATLLPDPRILLWQTPHYFRTPESYC